MLTRAAPGTGWLRGNGGTIACVAVGEPRRLAAGALYEYALRALARRSLTLSELRSRLERRAARKSSVDEVIERLRSAGYIDDERLAESYAFFRREYEGFGQQRVLRELRQRGVDSELAEQTVSSSYADADEASLIRRRLQRKLGEGYQERPIEDPKKVLSLYRALVRAGFSSDKIVEALRQISPDSDWLEAVAQHQDDSEQEVFD